MKSLNTYNYREELYMKPFSYQVSISDDDKIIKIEEDGDLIAELSFGISNNVLFLNGKDGLEVAQIELPLAMAAIAGQSYNAEEKSIELSILQTNGETMVFSLDVAELVNVYTAGDGIDINENVISIKIKDASGTLTVDEEGLDIDLDSLASSEDISNINSEIDQLQAEASNFKENVDASIVSIKEKLSEGFANFNGAIDSLKLSTEALEAELKNEIDERMSSDSVLSEQIDKVSFALNDRITSEVSNLKEYITYESEIRDKADANLQEQIGDVKGSLEGSIAEVLKNLSEKLLNETIARETIDADMQEQIGDVKGSLEGSISDAITDLQEQIGDVKGELEGSIAEAITDLQGQIGDVKGSLEGSIAEVITKMEEHISEETKIRDAKDTELEEKIDAEVKRATEADEALKSEIVTEIVNRTQVDEELQRQLGGGFSTISVTESVKLLKEAIDVETSAREENDNKVLNQLSIEKEERKSIDEDLKVHIITSREELANSIKLVKDENNNLKYILYVDGNIAGEVNIPADKMIEGVTYNEETKTLTFIWNTSVPQSPTDIYIGDLVDVYLAGDGLLIDGKTFKVNVGQSKYIDINENGSVEFVGVFEKPEGTSWKYDLVGRNGLNNGKFIDFTADYEAYDAHIKEVYAPITYVDAQDNLMLSTVIGSESDTATDNTFYGLRAAIAKSEDVTSAKIAEEKLRAENAEQALAESLETSIAETDAYIAEEIARVEGIIADKESAADIKHQEMAENIKANSDILSSLTNGEKTGVVDKLDKQFHEVTDGLNENDFTGIIKSLMDRISQLESTINILIGNKEVEGSVANMVESCLVSSKLYAQEKDGEMYDKLVAYADNKFQEKGEYLTEIDGKYITEDELIGYNYVNSETLSSNLSEYIKTETAYGAFQPKGNYLTFIPEEYVTETELETKHYATLEYVNAQDDKKLSKEMADLLYAPKDKYVTENMLNNQGYATTSYVDSKVADKATIAYVGENYQPKGNYLTSIPEEYLTNSELMVFNFATKSDVATEANNAKLYTDTKTHDMLTKAEASTIYQLKGEYITRAELTEKDYATVSQLLAATKDVATVSFVQSMLPKPGTYVTPSELASYGYVTQQALDSKQFVTLTELNGVASSKLDISTAEATYASKIALENHIASAFTAANIEAGNNIRKQVVGNTVQLHVELSSSYNVDDVYNQNLPKAGQNLDTVSEKLSEAIKRLYDTTDGELF